MWTDDRLQKLFGVELPVVQAPMAGSNDATLAAAVSKTGGLGSLPCAMLSVAQVRSEVAAIRRATDRPFNLNFFCHVTPAGNPAREAAWKKLLEPYYLELGIDPDAHVAAAAREPFDEAMCEVVEEARPRVVSFHFGLPEKALLERVRAVAKIVSSATTVEEARWLEERGCDAIIAQGCEAGGHRGMFLTEDVSTQVGTMALVPQVVDAVKVPVIATGGIADARGIAAALALGAAGVQIGTAFLFCPESKASPIQRRALARAKDNATALTNVFTGRLARGIVNRVMRELGPLSTVAPPFPLAAAALAPLRAAAEARDADDFTPLWAGQAAHRHDLPARELVRRLATETLAKLR